MKAAIVSAANADYFPLLTGLIQSIFDCRPTKELAIAVLDVGLEPTQAAELRASGVIVAEGAWDVDFGQLPPPPRWLQAMTARCRLPKYFPGFDLLIWIDADAWLQDWRAVDLLIQAASVHGFAIVPEVHRAYPHLYQLADPEQNQMRRMYRLSFPEEQANRLAASPLFNSGVFALQRDSQVWGIWSKWLDAALKGQPIKIFEQSALNAAIYFDRPVFYPLPAWCNWICGQSLPMYDPVGRRLLEPLLPFEPLSIIHVTPRSCAVADVKRSDGGTFRLPLDYLAYKSAIASL